MTTTMRDGTMTMSDQSFLAVWLRWDDNPAGAENARAMEDACIAKAAELGIAPRAFRDLLAAFRRAGCTRPIALATLRRAWSYVEHLKGRQ